MKPKTTSSKSIFDKKPIRKTQRWGKFGAKKCEDAEGTVYHSMMERDFIVELNGYHAKGFTGPIKTQSACAYSFVHNGKTICKYLPDAAFLCIKDFSIYSIRGMINFKAGQYYVIDVKSPATITQVYRMKKKMMLIFHGIEVIEIVRGRESKKKKKVPVTK